MNIIWTSIMLIGLSLLILNNVDVAISTLLSGSGKAISLGLKLWGIYALWLGVLKLVEDTQLDKKISKLLSPIINFLFGKTDNYTKEQISINLTSNILGMGNACTPSAINAMKGLDKGSKYATTSMIMLLILNATSLQIIPTTIIGLRSVAGSSNPADIVMPTLLSSVACTLLGIILVKICSKIFKDK